MKKMILFGLFTLLTQNITLYPSQIEGQPSSGRGEGQPKIVAADQKSLAEKTDAEKIATLIRWIKQNINDSKRESFIKFLDILLNHTLLTIANTNLQPSQFLTDSSKKALTTLLIELDKHILDIYKSQEEGESRFSDFQTLLINSIRTPRDTVNALAGVNYIKHILNVL